MKIQTTLSALSLLSILSFGSFAADSINADQAANLQAVGTVSVNAISASPMDIHKILDQKAKEQGASAYQIIEARTGAHWHVTAELYK